MRSLVLYSPLDEVMFDTNVEHAVSIGPDAPYWKPGAADRGFNHPL